MSITRSISRRASNALFFKLTQILCSTLTIIICSRLLINHHSDTIVVPREYLEAFNSIILTLKLFIFLFYGQILLPLRHLVLSVFMMIYDMLNFTFLWVLLSIPFRMCFTVIMTRYHMNLCHESYDGVFKAVYTNFKILLNMEPVSNFGLTNITGLAVTHFIFIAVNSFLLLNLLIAVFSDSISFVNDNAETLRVVQKLGFALSYSESFVSTIVRQFMKRKCKYFI